MQNPQRLTFDHGEKNLFPTKKKKNPKLRCSGTDAEHPFSTSPKPLPTITPSPARRNQKLCRNMLRNKHVPREKNNDRAPAFAFRVEPSPPRFFPNFLLYSLPSRHLPDESAGKNPVPLLVQSRTRQKAQSGSPQEEAKIQESQKRNARRSHYEEERIPLPSPRATKSSPASGASSSRCPRRAMKGSELPQRKNKTRCREANSSRSFTKRG